MWVGIVCWKNKIKMKREQKRTAAKKVRKYLRFVGMSRVSTWAGWKEYEKDRDGVVWWRRKTGWLDQGFVKDMHWVVKMVVMAAPAMVWLCVASIGLPTAFCFRYTPYSIHLTHKHIPDTHSSSISFSIMWYVHFIRTYLRAAPFHLTHSSSACTKWLTFMDNTLRVMYASVVSTD